MLPVDGGSKVGDDSTSARSVWVDAFVVIEEEVKTEVEVGVSNMYNRRVFKCP